MLVPCPLHACALKYPDQAAIIWKQDVWTWAELDSHVESLSIRIENDHAFGTSIALYRCTPLTLIIWVLAGVRANRSIVLFSVRDPEELVREKVASLDIPTLIIDEHILKDPFVQNIKGHPQLDPDSIATVLFTSGSTRSPKAVCHSLRNHLASADASHKNTPFQVGDRWLLSLSLWHIGGMAILFRAIRNGGTVVIPDVGRQALEHIAPNQITHLSVVAVQLQHLIDTKPNYESLKHVLVGGGPIPTELIRAALKSKIPIQTTYGMTELCSQFCTTPPGASIDLLNTAGFPLSGWELKLSENNEIWARGAPLFQGYFKDKQHLTTDSDGWFYTGDIGISLENGALKVVGRKDQMFISGGENISPEEIECTLLNLDGIIAVVVIPVPDKKYGARPVAIIKGTQNEVLIKAHLNKTLPKFKHPDYLIPWPNHISAIKPSRSGLRSFALKILSLEQTMP